MSEDILLRNGIIIPEHELTISTSKASGPGGQHVNKTASRITISWNLNNSNALDMVTKERLREKLASELTQEGNIIVHSSASRSQLHNKKAAYKKLAAKLDKALYVPKKRMQTVIPQDAQERRLESKRMHSYIKSLRKKPFDA